METEDECYVVMEFASGGELIEYIAARNYLTEKEARRFFRQIISAMDHCHLANVVHRDLKLENLLLTGDRNILISDFGLGRTFNPDAEEYMKTFCGTPNYAAVELISGIPYHGVKSDIWAMGVVLYVMMTGKPPFTGENISALYSKIKAVDYKCPDYFSKELKTLLSKMLKKDPKQRVDMDGLRADPWVNFEEVEKPLRIVPKVTENPDPGQISQFIASITKDKEFIIYTIRQHTREGNSVIGANPEKNKTLAKASGRRKSFSATPALAPGAQVTIKAPNSSINEDGEDIVSPLPNKIPSQNPLISAPRPRARRLSMQESSNRPVSMVEAGGKPAAFASPVGIVATALATGSPLLGSGGGGLLSPSGSRRSSSFNPEEILSMQNSGMSRSGSSRGEMSSNTLASSNANSISTTLTPSGSTTFGNRRSRRASINAMVLSADDRSLSVMRRMSVATADQLPANGHTALSGSPVSPSASNLQGPSPGPSSPNLGVSYQRRSSLSPSPSPLRRGVDEGSDDGNGAPRSSNSIAVSQQQMSNTHISNISSRAGSLDDDPAALVKAEEEMAAQMAAINNANLPPSKKEIEDWHKLHRPPKEIRSVRFAFNPRLTSQQAPSTVFQEVHRVLVILQKQFDQRLVFSRPDDHYLLLCKLKTENQDDDVEFEVEVCKIWLLKLHGVRIKRLGGNAFVFKDIYTFFCDLLNI
ncbi:MAP microtubule affinity-regulating kinase 1 [Blyttiomyces sp. JEL0837]|nr:MAP microtubule affinity-regulating kinase 1 [Blyttiomyces sp. JEL0837]